MHAFVSLDLFVPFQQPSAGLAEPEDDSLSLWLLGMSEAQTVGVKERAAARCGSVRGTRGTAASGERGALARRPEEARALAVQVFNSQEVRRSPPTHSC